MNPTPTSASLMLSVFFGALGAGHVMYGRRQRALPPFLSGVALIVFPYLVNGGLMTLLVGAAIAAVPYFLAPLRGAGRVLSPLHRRVRLSPRARCC